MIKTENRADIKVCIRELFIEKEKQKNESAGKRFIRMKRKQFLALILTVTLLAGSNITAAASVRTPAIRDAASAQGAMVEDGDTDQSSDKTLEQAMTDAIGQVSTGAAKEETVYVFTDAYGKQRDITVSNWLKNPEKKSTIEDESSLTDIENVKGDETFEQKGDKIVWKADGNDIFYQGTTTKQPPVTEKITYYLNDKEIKAEDLAGKSGKVRIHIDYTNNIKYKNVYVPFAAVTGMAFSNDTVSNIKVDNGSVVSEGKNSMVVGMAFPGLQDSLNTARQESKDIVNKVDSDNKEKALDRIDDLDIPDSVEVTMDVENFKMSNCLTMVFSNIFEMEDDDETKFDEDHKDAFDEMDEKVADLEKDGDDLADGTQELVDGAQEAKDGSDDLYDGSKKLRDGVQEYTDGVDKVNDGMKTLSNGTKKLTDNNKALNDGIAQLVNGTGTGSEKTLGSGIKSMQTGLKVLADGVSAYTSGVAAASSSLNAAQEDVEKLKDGSAQLADEKTGVPAYVSGVDQLTSSLLLPEKGGNDKVTDNITLAVGEIAAGTAQLKNGVDQVAGPIKNAKADIEKAQKVLEDTHEDTGKLIEDAKKTAEDIETAKKTIGEGSAKAEAIIEATKQAKQAAEKAVEAAKAAKEASDKAAADAEDASGKTAFDSAEDALGEVGDPINDAAESSKDINDDSDIVRTDVSTDIDDEIKDKVRDAVSGIDGLTDDQKKDIVNAVGSKASEEVKSKVKAKAEEANEVIQKKNEKLQHVHDKAQEAAGKINGAQDKVEEARAKAQAAKEELAQAAEKVSSAADSVTEASGKNSAIAQKAEEFKGIVEDVEKLNDDIAALKKYMDENLADDQDEIESYREKIAAISDELSKKDENRNLIILQELQAFEDGVNKLDAGAKELSSSLNDKQGDFGKLKKSGPVVEQGVKDVNDGVQKLYGSLYGDEGLAAGLGKMASKNVALNSGTKALQDGADALAAGIADANAGSIKLQKGIKEYTAGTDQLNKGTQTILDGTKKLSENSGKLNDGTDDLVDGVSKFVDGMQEMLDGCVELNDGVVEFREDGIRKMAEIYRENIKALDDSLMDIKDAAGTYKTFSGALDSTDNNVKFIIKTDSIELDED